MGFATIDPPFFMKAHFSSFHLLLWIKGSMFCFFEKVKTKGQYCDLHLNVVFLLILNFLVFENLSRSLSRLVPC